MFASTFYTRTGYSVKQYHLLDNLFCLRHLNCCLYIHLDGEAYAHLLNALALEYGTTATLDTKDPAERAKLVIEQAEKLDCKRYVTPKDIDDNEPPCMRPNCEGIWVDKEKIDIC
ncbi:hypothetical protein ACS0TY_016194 [Phlomoides rotata]